MGPVDTIARIGMMQRLVVTTSASGAGHLRQARIADRVITSHALDNLVAGPVPDASGPGAFFAARETAWACDPLFRDELYEWNGSTAALAHWDSVLSCCEDHERVEWWVDPSPNEQLLFIQSLCWLERHPAIVDKLHVVHADTALGGRRVGDLRTLQPSVVRIGSDAVRLACRAWQAFCQPTPTAWCELLERDLGELPHLRRTVLLMLGELPAVDTALGASERLALEIVAPGAVRPMRFCEFNQQRNPSRVFDLDEELRILNRLGGGPAPAIHGLTDTTFGLKTMDQSERRCAYMRRELSLSSLGRALLAGEASFADHNRLHRWWGGTRLTNDHRWSWDARQQKLLPPEPA